MTQYNKEFREQSGINYGTLPDWRKTRNRKNRAGTVAQTNRERQMLKEMQEFKDALVFFVKDRKN
jgi:hypothetical protein